MYNFTTLLLTPLFLGFPRTVGQAEKLGEKQELDVVINLDVPFETIIDRISVSVLFLFLKHQFVPC